MEQYELDFLLRAVELHIPGAADAAKEAVKAIALLRGLSCSWTPSTTIEVVTPEKKRRKK